MPLQRKIDAIVQFPAPQRQKQLLGFLGAVNYYRRSLQPLDSIAPAQVLQPLYDAATKKFQGTNFVKYWTDNKLENAFSKAKLLLSNATRLVFPDPQAPIALTTDASQYAIGGVLEQFSAGK